MRVRVNVGVVRRMKISVVVSWCFESLDKGYESEG